MPAEPPHYTRTPVRQGLPNFRNLHPLYTTKSFGILICFTLCHKGTTQQHEQLPLPTRGLSVRWTRRGDHAVAEAPNLVPEERKGFVCSGKLETSPGENGCQQLGSQNLNSARGHRAIVRRGYRVGASRICRTFRRGKRGAMHERTKRRNSGHNSESASKKRHVLHVQTQQQP